MATDKKKLVVLTGAGISAESGLQTFRDADGLWEGHNVYDVATPRGFAKDPALVLEFYNMRRKAAAEAQPNQAHKLLVDLEAYFDVAIITQNVDDLHERAGSSNVVHLHGELFKMRSVRDKETWYDIKGDIKLGDLAPDGHQLRPAIVWFEEEVPMMEKAAQITNLADIFVVVGTSLQVYPAAGLLYGVGSKVPIYIVDRKIPVVESAGRKIIPIEKKATEGVKELFELLVGAEAKG